MSHALPIAIILGAAVRADGTPAPALRRRTETGIALWKQGRVARLILSGAAMGGPITEAACMAALCRTAGLPGDAFVLEEAATSTWENLMLSKPLLAGAPAILITDHYHAPRALIAARAHGITARITCPPHPNLSPLRLARIFARELVACVIYLYRWARLCLSARPSR